MMILQKFEQVNTFYESLRKKIKRGERLSRENTFVHPNNLQIHFTHPCMVYIILVIHKRNKRCRSNFTYMMRYSDIVSDRNS